MYSVAGLVDSACVSWSETADATSTYRQWAGSSDDQPGILLDAEAGVVLSALGRIEQRRNHLVSALVLALKCGLLVGAETVLLGRVGMVLGDVACESGGDQRRGRIARQAELLLESAAASAPARTS